MPTISNSSIKFARIGIKSLHHSATSSTVPTPSMFPIIFLPSCNFTVSSQGAAFGPLPWLAAAPRKPSTAGPSASGCTGQHGYRWAQKVGAGSWELPEGRFVGFKSCWWWWSVKSFWCSAILEAHTNFQQWCLGVDDGRDKHAVYAMPFCNPFLCCSTTFSSSSKLLIDENGINYAYN